MMLVEEVVDFIIANYPSLSFADRNALIAFIQKTDNLHIERKDGEICMVAIYFYVDDVTLFRIATDNFYQADQAFLIHCMNQKGDNAHVYMAIHRGSAAEMLRTVRSAIVYHHPKTISWYNKDMTTFHLFNTRRLICHKP